MRSTELDDNEASMIMIDRIETVLVDLPSIRPHKLAMTTVNVQSIVLIRLFRSGGVHGGRGKD